MGSGATKHVHNAFDDIDEMYGRHWELHGEWEAYQENPAKAKAQKDLV